MEIIKGGADPKDLPGGDSSDDESANYVSRARSGDRIEEEEEIRIVHFPKRNKVSMRARQCVGILPFWIAD